MERCVAEHHHSFNKCTTSHLDRILDASRCLHQDPNGEWKAGLDDEHFASTGSPSGLEPATSVQV